MERLENSGFPQRRLIKALILPVLVLIPLTIVSCSIQQVDSDPEANIDLHAIVIEDLGVSLKLPEGWTDHQTPLRSSTAERMSLLNPSEEELRQIGIDNPDKIEHGVNMYVYTNVDEYEEGEFDEDMFFYFLSVEMHNYFDNAQRDLWKRGLCSDGTSCESGNPRLQLIRELDSEENPFENGTGFLHEIKVQEAEGFDRWVYIYYVVVEERGYKIVYDGPADESHSETYPGFLAGIDFFD